MTCKAQHAHQQFDPVTVVNVCSFLVRLEASANVMEVGIAKHNSGASRPQSLKGLSLHDRHVPHFVKEGYYAVHFPALAIVGVPSGPGTKTSKH